jgi:hypothetical protein
MGAVQNLWLKFFILLQKLKCGGLDRQTQARIYCALLRSCIPPNVSQHGDCTRRAHEPTQASVLDDESLQSSLGAIFGRRGCGSGDAEH